MYEHTHTHTHTVVINEFSENTYGNFHISEANMKPDAELWKTSPHPRNTRCW